MLDLLLAWGERRPKAVLPNSNYDAVLRELALTILPQKLVHRAAVLAGQFIDESAVWIFLTAGDGLGAFGISAAAPASLRLGR